MTKKERNERLELALLLSIIVFAINGSAMVITYFILFILAEIGIIKVIEGQIGVLDVSVFVFCSSLVIGFILSNSMGKVPLKPFNKLISQLNRLGRGDFKARIHFRKPINSHPLFKELETSFNSAAEELEHNEILSNDFINNFSHEFKTPIVSIAGFAKLLRKESLSDEEREEYLTVIEEESLRLSRMANNVLNLTRIENLTILRDISAFNLSEEIRSAVVLLEEKWSKKNISMNMDYDEYTIEGNKELLKQVWINLIENAIKFSPENDTITINVEEENAYISVSISNHGKDISEDSIKHIFTKFYQADESHSMEGNGIGLAVVKKVCALHSGEVTVKSSDGTTTFLVTLPVKH